MIYELDPPPGVDPSQTRLSSSAFTSSETCPSPGVVPAWTGPTVTLPEAPENASCSPSYVDVDSLSAYPLSTLSFTAAFTASTTAPSFWDEMAVFLASDRVNWTGQEFGITCHLSTGSLYGYLQDGNATASSPWDWWVPLGVPCDGGTHQFAATLLPGNGSVQARFCVDGTLAGSLSHLSRSDYASELYSLHLTTHRQENGWASTDDHLAASDLTLGGAPC